MEYTTLEFTEINGLINTEFLVKTEKLEYGKYMTNIAKKQKSSFILVFVFLCTIKVNAFTTLFPNTCKRDISFTKTKII